MSKKLVLAVFVFGVMFAGVFVWAVLTSSELGDTKDELSDTGDQLAAALADIEAVTTRLADTTAELSRTTSELALTRSQLAGTETELINTEAELASTEVQLTHTEGELAITKIELLSTESELAGMQTELTNIEGELASVQDELTDTKIELISAQQGSSSLETMLARVQEQLTVAQDTLEGLGIALYASRYCFDVDLVDNPEAANPTWSQLVRFLSQDRTEMHDYIENVYDCSEFSRDLHNNAEAAGIRSAEVQVRFENELIGHALNAFLTTDYGLVYVDCTESPDKIARIEAGKEHRSVNVSHINAIDIGNGWWWDSLPQYYYSRNSAGGHSVTAGIRIYW